MSCSLPSPRSTSFQDSRQPVVLTSSPHSHKLVREMEYELFRSKLKSSVDGALVSEIIRSSSSGLNSHRTAAMELILERSIQERRERMFAKAKDSVRPDPAPQPRRTSEAPNIPIPEVKPPVPAPAPQLPSQFFPGGTTGTATSLASASAKYEASQDLSAFSKPTKEIKATRGKQPPADVKTNPSPPEVFFELACCRCKVKQARSSLRSGIWCSLCPREARGIEMWCVGCGTIRWKVNEYCTRCHGKFK